MQNSTKDKICFISFNKSWSLFTYICNRDSQSGKGIKRDLNLHDFYCISIF